MDSYRKISFSRIRKPNVLAGLLVVVTLGAVITTTALVQQRQDLQQSASEFENITPTATSSATPTIY